MMRKHVSLDEIRMARSSFLRAVSTDERNDDDVNDI